MWVEIAALVVQTSLNQRSLLRDGGGLEVGVVWNHLQQGAGS